MPDPPYRRRPRRSGAAGGIAERDWKAGSGGRALSDCTRTPSRSTCRPFPLRGSSRTRRCSTCRAASSPGSSGPRRDPQTRRGAVLLEPAGPQRGGLGRWRLQLLPWSRDMANVRHRRGLSGTAPLLPTAGPAAGAAAVARHRLAQVHGAGGESGPGAETGAGPVRRRHRAARRMRTISPCSERS